MTKFEEELSNLPVSIVTNDGDYWNKAQLLKVFKDWQPQQALPVVPEFVAEFIESYKDRRTIYGVFDKISKNRKTYPKLYEWVFEDENSQATFALAFITGKYEVEKPQLFYFKHIDMSETDEHYDYYLSKSPKGNIFHSNIGKGKLPKLKCILKLTQQEIESLHAGSYELVPVEVQE